MNTEHAQLLRNLLETQQIASLGTLHQGEPYVSMTPFVLLPGASAFVIHVSGLAAHTKDMLQNPQVSLLVMAPQNPDIAAQALPRATIQGDALPLGKSSQAYLDAKQAYLGRFPESTVMFELPDFSLFAITPRSIRLVGGFAQAKTISPETLAKVVGEA